MNPTVTLYLFRKQSLYSKNCSKNERERLKMLFTQLRLPGTSAALQAVVNNLTLRNDRSVALHSNLVAQNKTLPGLRYFLNETDQTSQSLSFTAMLGQLSASTGSVSKCVHFVPASILRRRRLSVLIVRCVTTGHFIFVNCKLIFNFCNNFLLSNFLGPCLNARFLFHFILQTLLNVCC